MNYNDLTEEEIEELEEQFERECEELDRHLNRKSRDLPVEYVKESEIERLTRYDDGNGTHESWLRESGGLVDPENPFDEDVDD
jgi:hypothetical protein